MSVDTQAMHCPQAVEYVQGRPCLEEGYKQYTAANYRPALLEPTVGNTVNKATRTLNFFWHNLKTGSVNAKGTSYKILVRHILEYGSAVCDHYSQEGEKAVEAVPHRSVRFTLKIYHSTSSVAEMLDQLKKELLVFRQKTETASPIFYKIANNFIAIATEGYLIPTNSRTGASHQQK